MKRLPRGACLLVLSFALLVATYGATWNRTVRFSDETAYKQIAIHLASGDGFTSDGLVPTGNKPLGYPLILAAIRLVHLPIVPSAYFLNVLVVGAGVCLLGARLRNGWNANLGTTLAWGSLGALWISCLFVYPQALVGGLLLIAFTLASTTSEKARALSISSLALAVLCIPQFVVFLPALAVVMRRSGASRLALAAAVALCLVPSGLWSMRNAQQLGVLAPATNSGFNLYLGNNEHATFDSGADVPLLSSPAAHETETQNDERYRAAATEWIGRHPGRALSLFGEKLAYFFSPYNSFLTSGANSQLSRVVLFVGSLFPIAAFILSVIALCLGRLGAEQRWIFASIVAYAILQSLFYSRIRYRVPIDGLLLMVALSATRVKERNA